MLMQELPEGELTGLTPSGNTAVVIPSGDGEACSLFVWKCKGVCLFINYDCDSVTEAIAEAKKH